MSHAHVRARQPAPARAARPPKTKRAAPSGVPRFLRSPAPAAGVGVVQRKCARCEEEERVDAKAAPGADPDLTVGAADDPLEREADATAEAVVRRMAAPGGGTWGRAGGAQASPAAPAGRAGAAVPAPVGRSLRGRGAGGPLPQPVRGRMEAAFGADFSDVRLHTGPSAAEMSRALNARAFTHGRDVYFASGHYDPCSREGGLLLAHELTHVVQQTGPGDVRRAPSPTPPPATQPTLGAGDFEMKRQPRSSWTRIYFAKGSSKLSGNDRTELGMFKLLLSSSVSVTGYASVEESASVAQDRADAVKAELEKGPDKATVTAATGNARAMEGTSDLPRARSAEIVEATGKAKVKDCKLKDGRGKLVNPPTEPCTKLDPKTWSAFQAAHGVAKTAMAEASSAVSPLASDDEPLVDRFFGAHDAATLTTLKTNLGRLESHVKSVDGQTSCGAECDTGGCESGSVIAYNNGEVDAKSRLTLCVPGFRSLGANDQVRNVIHETAHGTSPLGGARKKGTKDVAYRHERMLAHLSTSDRLRNSDSYALFALHLHEFRKTGRKGAAPSGISTFAKDDVDKAFTGREPAQLALALARLEKRLSWCRQWMTGLFGEMAGVRGGTTTWARSWAKDLMNETAKLFPVAPASGKPTASDQARVAAMLDRYTRMYMGVKRDLKVGRMATGVVRWPSAGKTPIVGASLELGPDFFKATADDQVSLLVQHLARATRDVETAFVPAYVALAAWIHGKNP